MGEIRVRVRLTNAVDAALEREGTLTRRGGVRAYEGEAVVDAGAVWCVVPQRVATTLGLKTRGVRAARQANGRTMTVPISDPILFDLGDRDTVEDACVRGDEIRIGMTVLAKLDLRTDAATHRVFPNPAHPNQPVNTIRRRP